MEKKKPKKRDRKKYHAEYREKGKDKEIPDDVIRKQKQRQREDILRFHIRRDRLGMVQLPEGVKEQQGYQKAVDSYEAEIAQTTIVD